MKFFDKGWCCYGFTDRSDGNAKNSAMRNSFLTREGLSEGSFVCGKQVHGDSIEVVRDLNQRFFESKDGFMTDCPGIVLGVFTADCTPIVLMEPGKRVAAVLHAGWKGTVQGIAEKGVQLICEDWKTNPSLIKVHLGPAIQDCCYEVGQEVADRFPEQSVRFEKGKFFASMQKAILCQLEKVGVLSENILKEKACSCCDSRFFSYRRDKGEERMCAFIAIRK